MIYVCVLLALAGFAFSLRYNWWRKTHSYKKARVLMYHSISEHVGKERQNKWRVKPDDFAQQMHWLSENGWHSVTMSELIELETLPEKTVAITFDDGFADNCKNALPILKKYHLKATIYLVPNQIKNYWEKDNTTQLSQLLNSEQIRKMQGSGLVEFGAHTLSHLNLSTLSPEEIAREVTESKAQVEQISQQPCNAFAYPYGKFDETIIESVKNAGYTSATVVKRGLFTPSDNHLTINRLGILGTESFLDFRLRLAKIRNKL